MSGMFTIIIIMMLVSVIGGVLQRGRIHQLGHRPPQYMVRHDTHTPRSFTRTWTGQLPGPFGQPPDRGQSPYGGHPPYQLPAPGAHPGHGYGQHADQPLSDASRSALDADITRFGGELRDLDLDVVGLELDTDARADYTAALDSYENVKQSLRNATLDSDATVITHMLEEGRHKIASVKARAHGQPVPERRPPCFFDPAHGPSTTNVSWSPEGGVAREVPACALDAARVTSGYNPNIRMVSAPTGAMVPYWEDDGHAAWARGYYDSWGMDPTVRGLTQGAMMIGGFALLMNLFDD